MGDYEGFELDRATTRAWGRFRVELADHIVAMEEDDVTIIRVESSLDEDAEGTAPYVQFFAWCDDLVRAEVSSNEYLDAEVGLDAAGEQALVDLGWSEPTHSHDDAALGSGSANFHLDLERRQGDRIAAMAVSALRDVFGVPHPAFLDWPTDTASDDDVDADALDADAVDAGDSDAVLAMMPGSPENLRRLVVDALTPPGGPEPEPDEDGDIPLPMGSALLFVRVNDVAPLVEIFAFVVRGAIDKERAAFEVGVLNRDTKMIKFVLLDDLVLASVHVPAAPFAPRQLRRMVVAMAEAIDRVDDDLMARVGGRRGTDLDLEDDEGSDAEFDSGGEDAHGTDPALKTLLHLDPHGKGAVEPELAASVCEFDRNLVLRLLDEAGEQEIDWRKAGNRALLGDDHDEADACFGEACAWQATLETLRKALRVIVERQRAEDLAAYSRVVEQRRHRSSRHRRHGADAQQSLVDELRLRRDVSGQDVLFEQRTDGDDEPEVS